MTLPWKPECENRVIGDAFASHPVDADGGIRIVRRPAEAAEASLIATGVAGVLALVALGVYRRRALPRWVTGAAFAAALVASTLLGWTANLGGRIRHAEIGGTAAAPAGELEGRER